MILEKYIDPLIPVSLRDELDQRVRSRILVSLLLFNVLIWPFGQILIYIFRTAPQEQWSRGHLFFTLVSLFAITTLYSFRRLGAFVLISNLFVGSGYITILCAYFGLQHAPASIIQCFFVIPALAFTLVGYRAGVYWTVLTATSHVACLLAPKMSALINPGDQLLEIFITLVVYCVLVITINISASINRSMALQLRSERNVFDYQAHHDPLTNLANRSGFSKSLSLAIQQAELHKEKLALIYIDLDNFKPINDELGHAAGDNVLEVVASRLNAVLRSNDLAARLGGDEFAVVLSGLQCQDKALSICDEIRRQVSAPIMFEGKSLEVTASVGLALYPDHAQVANELWHFADHAMYEAKSSKNSVAMYH